MPTTRPTSFTSTTTSLPAAGRGKGACQIHQSGGSRDPLLETEDVRGVVASLDFSQALEVGAVVGAPPVGPGAVDEVLVGRPARVRPKPVGELLDPGQPTRHRARRVPRRPLGFGGQETERVAV